ncbi:SRSO17 transposase [Bradyrhizobium sp. F1.2.2]
MDCWSGMSIADRFAAYVGELTKVIGHADRAGPLRDYCSGLLATEGRRSVEPMAAVTAPAQVSAQHQKLLHFIANSEWSDEQVLAKVRDLVTPSMTRQDRSKPGSSTIRRFPRKAGIRSECIISIADNSASKPIARWP